MQSPLRILHLEDDAKDAELLQAMLEAEGIVSHVTRVDSQADFLASLEQGGFDLILADYALPLYDGLSALQIVRAKCPDVPFIFVSGTMGEEVAIESLKVGATDYVLKERLSRIVPSVQRALREARERVERSRAEEAARGAKARFEGILEIAQDAIVAVDAQQRIILFNQGAERVFGYTQAEAIGRSLDLLLPQCFEDVHRQHIADFARSPEVARTMGQPREVSGRRKDGGEFPAEASISKLDLGSEPVFTVILRDITERKRAEAELRESEQKYRTLFDSIDEGFCTIEVLFDEDEKPVDYRFLQVNPSFERQTGIKNAVGRRMREIAPQHEEHWFEIYGKIALTREPMRFENEAKELGRWYDVYAFRVDDPKLKRVGVLFNDITDRKQAEEELRESERRYRYIFQAAGISIWEEDFSQVKAALDELKAQGVLDFRQYLAEHPEFIWQVLPMVKVIDVNDTTVKLFAARSKEELLVSLDKVLGLISVPEVEEVFAGELIAIAEGQTSYEFENRAQTLKGDKLTVLFTITFPPETSRFDNVLVSITDITERKRAEEERRQAQATQFEISLETRVRERTRIARELHDTLLQSFQGLLLRFQSVLKILPERPLEARQRLESAIDQAAQAITDARDAIQGLRSLVAETGDLARAITAVGEELTANRTDSNPPAIDVEVEGAPRTLNPVVRDEAYRIAGEALRNAFRHAQARRITVEIRYDKRQFRLRVRDDGKGIDEETVRRAASASQFGLLGMLERAENVGGRLEVRSRLDSGTEVELSIAGAIAYGGSARRSWLSRVLSGNSRDNRSTES